MGELSGSLRLVPYRNELEAAQARIAALESELDEMRRERSERALVVQAGTALAPGQAGVLVQKGMPQKARFIETLEGELPEGAYAELVDLLRSVDAEGQLELLPSALRWRGTLHRSTAPTALLASITSRRGETVVSLELDFEIAHQHRMGWLGSGAGVAMFVSGIALANVFAPLGLLAVPLLPLGMALGRRWSRAKVKEDLASIEGLFAALLNVVRENLNEAA